MYTLAKIRYSTALLFIAIFLFSGTSQSQTKFQFASIKNLAEQEIAAKIMIPIFNSAGFDIEISPMPAARARLEATAGKVDGDLLRIFSYGENNTTMVRVPTSYSTVETAAFALESRNISIKTQDDLGKHTVVIIRGVQTTRDLTKGMPNVIVLNSLQQVIKFVAAGRGDIFITSDIAAMAMLKKLKITSIVPILDISSLPLYLYFNNKYKNMVPQIDSAIQKKQKSGVLQKLRIQYEKEYLISID